MRNKKIAVPVSFCGGRSTGELPTEEASKSPPFFLQVGGDFLLMARTSTHGIPVGLFFRENRAMRWPKILRDLILFASDIASPSESHLPRLLESVVFYWYAVFEKSWNAGKLSQHSQRFKQPVGTRISKVCWMAPSSNPD